MPILKLQSSWCAVIACNGTNRGIQACQRVDVIVQCCNVVYFGEEIAVFTATARVFVMYEEGRNTNKMHKIFVSDYDGTITDKDFYSLLAERYAPADTPDYFAQ